MLEIFEFNVAIALLSLTQDSDTSSFKMIRLAVLMLLPIAVLGIPSSLFVQDILQTVLDDPIKVPVHL